MIKLRHEKASKRLGIFLLSIFLMAGLLATFLIVGHKTSGKENKSATNPTITIQPGVGFGPAAAGAGPGDKWWMTSTNASVELSGTALSFAQVSLTLVSTPCGIADIKINEQTYHVKNRLKVAALVRTDSSGHAQIPVVAISSFCQPRNEVRTLFALIDEPTVAVIGPSTNPVIVPLAGFAPREGTPLSYGYWMTSKLGSIQVSGQPSSQVAVSLTLVPTPCGPARVMINGTKYFISKNTKLVIPVILKPTGNGFLNVSASNQACSPKGDIRTLYAMVFTPSVVKR